MDHGSQNLHKVYKSGLYILRRVNMNHGPQTIREMYVPVHILYVQFVNLGSQTIRIAY